MASEPKEVVGGVNPNKGISEITAQRARIGAAYLNAAKRLADDKKAGRISEEEGRAELERLTDRMYKAYGTANNAIAEREHGDTFPQNFGKGGVKGGKGSITSRRFQYDSDNPNYYGRSIYFRGGGGISIDKIYHADGGHHYEVHAFDKKGNVIRGTNQKFNGPREAMSYQKSLYNRATRSNIK